MIEAYLAGADSMECGCYDPRTKKDAAEWFDNEYGTSDNSEECDCCEDDE
jgi:hypothetical protein